MAECLRQNVQTDGPAYKHKQKHTRSFQQMLLVPTRGVTKVRVSDADRNCLAGI